MAGDSNFLLGIVHDESASDPSATEKEHPSPSPVTFVSATLTNLGLYHQQPFTFTMQDASVMTTHVGLDSPHGSRY